VAGDSIQYSAVLADLEERKKALWQRLESLDAAIAGIRALIEASEGLVPGMVAPPVYSAPAASLVRTYAPLAQQHLPEHLPQQQFAVRAYSAPAPAPAALRPSAFQQTPADDGRASTGLNIYVNANTQWASKQFISPDHTRSIFRKKTGLRCPKCDSQDTRVSVTRGFSDLFMFLFDYSIGRCRNCDTRFRIWKPRENELPEAEPALD
jgi:hypothetical protein